MIQKYFAVFLVFVLSSMAAAPAFAGDYMNARLLPNRLPLSVSAPAALATSAALPSRTTFSEIAATAAFAPQQPGQTQSSPAAPSRHWSKGGKILTFVGLGLIAAGAIMMTKQNQVIGSTSTEDVYINWKATGGGFMGGGALLTILGLTRRSD